MSAANLEIASSGAVALMTSAEEEQNRPTVETAQLQEAYTAHFSMVWRSLRRLGVPHNLLEDATQDVFLIVHRRWSEFEGRSLLKTWIFGIALRVAKDYRRAASRHAHRVERFAVASEPARGGCPAEEAERREANRLLHVVLASLREEYREVFILVELEQLPVREAAAALRLHVRTCQRRLRAARQQFEAQLATHLGCDRRSP